MARMILLSLVIIFIAENKVKIATRARIRMTDSSLILLRILLIVSILILGLILIFSSSIKLKKILIINSIIGTIKARIMKIFIKMLLFFKLDKKRVRREIKHSSFVKNDIVLYILFSLSFRSGLFSGV